MRCLIMSNKNQMNYTRKNNGSNSKSEAFKKGVKSMDWENKNSVEDWNNYCNKSAIEDWDDYWDNKSTVEEGETSQGGEAIKQVRWPIAEMEMLRTRML